MQHDFPFDPTYGYDEATLRAVAGPLEPQGFVDFWERTYAETLAIPLRLKHRLIDSVNSDVETMQIEFDGLGGFRVGGWLTVPKKVFCHGAVISHGYGGRDGPADTIPGPPAAAIFPCARGFNLSASSEIPGVSSSHVLHGIASRQTYIHRFCAADLWSATSVLLELYPHLRDRIYYQGGSFGGGIGALAVPWDSRISKAFFDIPSFGNHPLRVMLACVGSGEAVRMMYQNHPEILRVLNFFDAAISARHVRIPTLTACALFDPAVPPPGQFCVFNSLGGPKELIVRPAAHFDYPAGPHVDVRVFERVDSWLKAGTENVF